MSKLKQLGLGLALAGAALTAAPASTSAGAILTPHKAEYILRLGDIKTSGRFADIRGFVRSSLEQTCEGWITAETIHMIIDTRVGGEIRRILGFTGWESTDGKAFRFASRSKSNDEDTQTKGTAKLGRASFTKPQAKTLDLPSDTRFPVGLLTWLVSQASAGNRQAQAHVFDGTDDRGPEMIVAFFGLPKAADTALIEQHGDLTRAKAWNIRVAAYPLNSRSAEPEYEYEAKLLENGVMAEALLDFGDFTVVQELKSVESVPRPSC